jgi:plasmid stabilization system protein ParE
MAYKIRWSPRAAFNLEATCKYIARDSERYASLFAKKIVSLIKALPKFPKIGRIVPEYHDENLREIIYGL